MERSLVRGSRIILALIALGVALFSLRVALAPLGIAFSIDPGIFGLIRRMPWQTLFHMVVGPVALLTGPIQFFPQLRRTYPRLHRWVGRVYVVACLISGVAALSIAPFATGGPVAGIGFGLLAVCWIVTTAMGWRTAWAGQFARHRIWMRYSYALTFSAVTLRLEIPIGFIFFGFHSYAALSCWLAYLAWIPNVIVVALYTYYAAPLRRAANPATPPAA